MSSKNEIQDYVRTAAQAARAGGAVLMRYFSRPLTITYKGRIDPVSQADRHSQRTIISILRRRFPGHGIIAEEGDEHSSRSAYRWIIDPLDGTVNFIHGVPLFSVSVALMRGDSIIAGVVYAPALKEMYRAGLGTGAFLNGRALAVSRTRDLVRSLVVTGFPYSLKTRPSGIMRRFERVIARVQGVRRLGSAALDLSWVAAGRFEGFWEQGLAPWDVAAGTLIVREAGGMVSDFSGTPDVVFGSEIVAANRCVHDDLRALLKSRP